MSNSPLVNYTRISPNRTAGRTHKIDTITIHCVVGQASVESLGAIFAQSSKRASSNYGVGYDGRIGMYVEEKDRSWCSSNGANDNRAVTIEVASDNYYPYAVNSAAYNAMIKLTADICKRNGIRKLLWRGDPSLVGQVDKQNMTVHRWFANKSCPGEYLYSRMGQIAAEVNKFLAAGDDPAPEPEPVVVRVKPTAQMIQYGSEGDAVAAAQMLLNGWAAYLQKTAFLCGTVDGIFGTKTDKAVRAFQKEYGLVQDGIIGESTWTYLLC